MARSSVRDYQAQYLQDAARERDKGYQIGAADTRYELNNIWETEGKRTKYDKYSKGKIVKKAGTKLSKKQRKHYAKAAKRWEEKYGGRQGQIDDKYSKGMEAIKNAGMTKNGIPVDFVDGKARYAMEPIAQGLGLSEQEIKNIQLYTAGTGHGKTWKDSGLSYKDYRKVSEKVKGASTKNKGKYAMYQNFSQLDPIYADVKMNKDADQMHMAKMDFAAKSGTFYNMNMRDKIHESEKAGWAEKYAQPILKSAIVVGAGMINPAVGAAFATAMQGIEASEAGNFSWGNMAKNAAVNAAAAYIGGSDVGPMGKAAMREGLQSGLELAEGDFDLETSLKRGATNVGTAGALDLIGGAVTGGIEGYQSGEGVMSGIKTGLAGSELGGYAQSLGMISPMESVMDADMFAGVTEADFIDPNEMTMQEQEKFYNTGEMYSPGGSMYIPGIEFVGIEPGQIKPGNILDSPLDDELQGMGGEMTRVYGDNPLHGGGLGVGASPEAIAKWQEQNGNIQADNANIEPDEGMFGDLEWEDALPFLSSFSPILSGLLSSSQKKRGTGGGGDTYAEEIGDDNFADLYNQGAGSIDPYSTQQMFGAGIQ